MEMKRIRKVLILIICIYVLFSSVLMGIVVLAFSMFNLIPVIWNYGIPSLFENAFVIILACLLLTDTSKRCKMFVIIRRVSFIISPAYLFFFMKDIGSDLNGIFSDVEHKNFPGILFYDIPFFMRRVIFIIVLIYMILSTRIWTYRKEHT